MLENENEKFDMVKRSSEMTIPVTRGEASEKPMGASLK